MAAPAEERKKRRRNEEAVGSENLYNFQRRLYSADAESYYSKVSASAFKSPTLIPKSENLQRRGSESRRFQRR